jgi:quercetin dioxygenase-like cupin family protein
MERTNNGVLRVGPIELRFLVDETQGSGGVVMFEFTIPANARVPTAHYHQSVDEAVYGLEGTLTTTVDGVKHEIQPGGFVLIPRGRVHVHENLHEDTARALAVLNPGSIGRRYFEETAEAVNGSGRPDPAKIRDIMLRHGLVPA